MTAPTPCDALDLCPFCGGEAAFATTRYGYPASHWVKCCNCGSCTTEYSNRGSAASAWNTRTQTEAAFKAREEALVEALEQAENALRLHACHGEDAPCRRDKSECASECGFAAGNALTSILALLTRIKGETS